MAKRGMRVTGAKQLDKVLRDLAKVDNRAGRKVMRQALTVAAKPIVRDAKAKVAKRSGNLRRSIGAVSPKGSGTKVSVKVGPRTGGKWKGFHGHLVEFGHALVRGGKVIGHVPAKPFMRPAWDTNKGGVLRTIGREIGPRIEKEAARLAKKHRSVKRRRR